MTAPEIDLSKRHLRTIVGIILMAASIAYVVATHVLHVVQLPCATGMWEIVQTWVFPGLLFVGGYNLFDSDALRDLTNAIRNIMGKAGG